MRVCIYGAGAVGLGLAGFLIKAGADVDIVARPATVDALNKKGLTRTGIFGDFYAASDKFAVHTTLSEINKTKFDFVMVCTKSFDSQKAAQTLTGHKQLLAPNAKIVLFQNGWGNAEKFLDYFSKEQIYNARIITGFSRVEPNKVEITVHAEAIHIGSLFGRDLDCLRRLCEAINEGGIDCRITESIEKDLWAKMLYNCSLNPIGAILGVPYGKLTEVRCTRQLMDVIIAEVYDVMASAGYETHWPCVDDFLKVFYDRLVPDTAGHKSSMLQDISAGKKTEIDALNGEIIKLAAKYNLAVPYNKEIYELVKSMEVKI